MISFHSYNGDNDDDDVDSFDFGAMLTAFKQRQIAKT